MNNCDWAFSVAVCTPISTPSPPKRCGRILSAILTRILSGIPSGGWGPAVVTGLGRSPVEVQRCPLASAVEVQRCPLNSGGPRLRSIGAHWPWEVPSWGPAVPTTLKRSPVEVQQCPLISGDGCWGPAAPTGIGSWQLRPSSAHCDQELARRRGEEEEEEGEGGAESYLKI